MSRIVEKIAALVSGNSRKKKFETFIDEMAPRSSTTIIDVGVTDEEFSPFDNYLEKRYPYPEMITAVSQSQLRYFSDRYPRVNVVVGDGLALTFADKAFDISYSNAVIEHVGSRPAQIAFLRELSRVSRRGYVTTPSRFFPIEVHTRVPLLHLLLSKARFDRFLSAIGKDWAAGDYMNLLGKRELISILAIAGIEQYTIKTSRLLGFPLTYTVTWGSPERA